MRAVWISTHSEEETHASSLLQPQACGRGKDYDQFEEELQRELDRSRIEIGNDHDHDYHDGCRNDLDIGRIVLALVVVVHLDWSSLSSSSGVASASSTPSL